MKEEEEMRGSDDDEQEDPADYCKGFVLFIYSFSKLKFDNLNYRKFMQYVFYSHLSKNFCTNNLSNIC